MKVSLCIREKGVVVRFFSRSIDLFLITIAYFSIIFYKTSIIKHYPVHGYHIKALHIVDSVLIKKSLNCNGLCKGSTAHQYNIGTRLMFVDGFKGVSKCKVLLETWLHRIRHANSETLTSCLLLIKFSLYVAFVVYFKKKKKGKVSVSTKCDY